MSPTPSMNPAFSMNSNSGERKGWVNSNSGGRWGGTGEEKGPLERLVKNVIKNIGQKGGPSEEEMAKAWGLAVGKRALRHTRPVSLKKAGLVVNVDRSSWLYELTLKKKEIIRNLSGRVGGKKIKDIRFRIGEIKK